MFLHSHILLLYLKVSKLILVMSSHLHLQTDRPKKLLIPTSTVCCVISYILLFDMGMHKCLEKNIDMSKVKVGVGVQHFFSQSFKYFYITIWSCMKLKDVLEVLPIIKGKTCIFNWSLWLKFSRIAIKISLLALDKSHKTLVANDKGYWMKEKINKYKFIFWFHCIHIVTCDYDTTILVTIETNDVLPHVLILNYLKCNNNYYFEII
jgi:hypothetical protein